MSSVGTFSQLCSYRPDGAALGKALFPAAIYQSARADHELERVPPSGCIVLGGSRSAVEQREETGGTGRARRLCDAVRAFAQATHYAEPARNAKNAWGCRFADLLAQSDLALARPAIEAIAAQAPPVGIFGAVLLARIDRSRGERRLLALARSTLPVRVVTSPAEKAYELALADIARDWLAALGLDSEAP
jgi:hypothetical protein